MSDGAGTASEHRGHAHDNDLHPSTIPKEARPFQGRRAGVVSRTLAGAVDFGVVALVTVGGYFGYLALVFLWSPSSFRFPSFPFGLLLLVGAGVLFLYLSVSWWSVGRTYGGHVLGLRVVNSHGERMWFGGAMVRAAFCTLFPIGLFWVALSPQNRSVQDVVLRTSVIHDWEVVPARTQPVRDPLER